MTELATRPPDRIVKVEPSAFADDCRGRPKSTIDVGIRRLSELDLDVARAASAKHAWALHPDPIDVDKREECYVEALMRWAVARGTCKPLDASTGFFQADEDEVRAALSPNGVKFLYEHVERMHIEMSPLNPLLDRAGAQRLAGLLLSLPGADDASLLADLAPSKAARVRRLLGFALAELTGA